MKKFFLMLPLAASCFTFAHAQEAKKQPFEGFNTTWINGQSRQTEFPISLTDKSGTPIVTAMAYVDGYFNYDFRSPKDNTYTGSSTIGRTNEFTLNLATLGIETYYKNTIGRLWLQAGSGLSLIQETDASLQRGRNNTLKGLENIREAAAGYHFDMLHGLNIEMGIFSSFIGMDSYLTQENWSYQKAIINDLVPSYFTGLRLQLFPSWRYKTELWVVNGWQSYNRWNNMPGIGWANLWRPNENIQLTSNFYVGKDSQQDIKRFHNDNSIAYRYYTNEKSIAISQAAISINAHFGFQWGDGTTINRSNILGVAAMNRIWFCSNKLGLTLRYDFINHPGLYLASSPSPIIPNAFTEALNQMEKPALRMHQVSISLDYMPNSFSTFRVEYGYRSCNVPYFAGSQGTTSADGWVSSASDVWQPSLFKSSQRITVAFGLRL